MINCPNCEAYVDGLVCPKCKYSEAAPAKAGKPAEHRTTVLVHGRSMSLKACDHEDRGQRCAGIAVFSPSTTGSGLWFCQQHDPTRGGRRGPRTPPPLGFQALRDIMAASQPAAMRQPGEEG